MTNRFPNKYFINKCIKYKKQSLNKIKREIVLVFSVNFIILYLKRRGKKCNYKFFKTQIYNKPYKY